MKEETQELALRETTPPATVPATGHASVGEMIMQMTANPDCDADKLQKLIDVRQQWEADEARKAYAAALAGFQADCPTVPKLDSANGRPYAAMDRIWSTIRPCMAAHRLAVSWQSTTFADGVCVLDGTLTQAAGHSQPIHYELAVPDGIRGQNKAQVCGSAVTYAKRYAICSILGVQVGEDDDAGACAEFIGEAEARQIEALIEETGADKARFLKWLGVPNVGEITTADHGKALAALMQKREESAK